jgi:hypothetical protein
MLDRILTDQKHHSLIRLPWRNFACHPEQPSFARRKDLGEPRHVAPYLRHNNRAFGSLPYQTAHSLTRLPRRSREVFLKGKRVRIMRVDFERVVNGFQSLRTARLRGQSRS